MVDTGGSTSQPTSIRFGIHVNADVIDNQVDTVYASAGDTSVHGIYLSDPAATARNNRVRDLVSSGTGYAYGIRGLNNASSAVGNHVVANRYVTVNGAGLSGFLICHNNEIIGFSAPVSCTITRDNTAVN